MKILHVVPSYLPASRYGGPIYSVHGLCRSLASLGHEVHVFTTSVDGDGDSDVPHGQAVNLDGVTVWYFPSRRLRRLFYAPGLAKALDEQVGEFDIVHLHSVFLWPTLAAVRAARKHGVPYILAPRGMLNADLIAKKSRWAKKAWIALFERRNIAHAAALHLTSAIEGRELAGLGFELPATVFVPNGIDLDFPQRCSSGVAAGSEEFVLFLGRINWKKGLDRLIRAWRLVPAAKLVIAGNDEENYRPQLERLAADEGVAARIEFIGPVSGDEKWRLFQSAALFVLPSYSENFGVAVLEAMAAGCAVVVTPEVGLAETVAGTGCGLVAQGSTEPLGRALASLLRDPVTRMEMGRRGREIAERQFSWPVVASRMEQVYAEVLTREVRQAKRVTV